jgi:hypothetical protein
VLLVLLPVEHLWIGRNRGQFVPYSDAARWPISAQNTAEDPGSTRPERHFPSGAAQTRIVSVARIRLDSRQSVRSFKGIICGDISEFESYMASHAVGSPPGRIQDTSLARIAVERSRRPSICALTPRRTGNRARALNRRSSREHWHFRARWR